MSFGGNNTAVEETPEERLLAEIAKKEYLDYVNNVVPLQNAYIKDSYLSAGDYQRLAGQAARGITSQVRTTPMQAPSRRSAMAKQLLDTAIAQGTLAAGAQVQGYLGARRYQNNRLMGAIAMGRGQQAGAIGSMGQVASDALSTTIRDKRLDIAGRNALGTAIGTGVGMGTAYYLNKNEGG